MTGSGSRRAIPPGIDSTNRLPPRARISPSPSVRNSRMNGGGQHGSSPAPVVGDEGHVAQVELVDHRERVLHVALERVRGQARRLLGAAEAHVVVGDAAVAGGAQLGERLAPQEAPGGVAVEEQQRRSVRGSLVDVVEAGPAGPEVTRLEREGATEVAVECVCHRRLLYISSVMATEQKTGLHGGRLVAKRLKAHGVTKLFTLSGGHLFSIYDGCREEGIDIVDVRHEQSAAFAAEGWAKATREPGVCALTAGPGVTNGMSPMASGYGNASPMLVLGGRAPAFRWGQGSLQEIDHVPFVEPLTKLARTAEATADIPSLVDEALRAAVEAPSGPTFIDFPMDQVFMEADVDADAP